MKTFKNVLLPAVIAIAGISAAFATNAAKRTDTILETGYYFDGTASPIKCIATPEQCTIVDGPTCTWTDANNVSHDLKRRTSSVMCGVELHKP